MLQAWRRQYFRKTKWWSPSSVNSQYQWKLRFDLKMSFLADSIYHNYRSRIWQCSDQLCAPRYLKLYRLLAKHLAHKVSYTMEQSLPKAGLEHWRQFWNFCTFFKDNRPGLVQSSICDHELSLKSLLNRRLPVRLHWEICSLFRSTLDPLFWAQANELD